MRSGFDHRGHRLISDDTVIVKKIGKKLEGYAPELTAGHMEIRGLGIINIRDLFGVSSVEPNRKIDLSIELRKWSESEEIERLGLETTGRRNSGNQNPEIRFAGQFGQKYFNARSKPPSECIF